jgi:histidyl-tRNA synthetase
VQLYNFLDKSGRRLSLRPELTPSLARLLLGRHKGALLPSKWFTVGQCWRYERMTRGRRREHYQWNMDVVGVPGVSAEAELLAAVTSFFARVGLSPADVGVRVSSRKVLAALLARAGVAEDAFPAACVVVDKLDKLPRADVLAELAALGVPPDAGGPLLDALAVGSLDALAALLGEGHEAVVDLRALWALAARYGYAEWLLFDATVVRGLSYYTGVVFEAFDRARSLR